MRGSTQIITGGSATFATLDGVPGDNWLAARAVLFSDDQTLTQLQQERALANLGITIAADGLLTLPTGHTIYLNAPAP